MRVEVDGHPATAEELSVPAVVNYGHITTMQVRDGRVRGLELHLRRLDAANRELFGTGLAGDRVRGLVRHALGADKDAGVRVTVFEPSAGDPVSVMVVVRPPADPPTAPQRLRSVEYQRPAPHLKHVGGFGQIYHGLRAERDGFDDALLVGPGGVVAESTIANLGLFSTDGDVVWPDAPALTGITMQLLVPLLPSRRASVSLADLPRYDGAFLANSRGWWRWGGSTSWTCRYRRSG
jgi:branched-subunit amino acid aminotransferase/4-amino-4-deoxychorismate lyase